MERTALINIPGLDLLSLLSPLSLHRRGGAEEAIRSRTGGVKPCCRCADLIRKAFLSPPENFHLFGGSFLERRRKKKLFGRVVANNSGEGDRSKKGGGGLIFLTLRIIRHRSICRQRANPHGRKVVKRRLSHLIRLRRERERDDHRFRPSMGLRKIK